MIKGPCLDCPDRHPNCHSSCDKYLDYKSKLAEQKKLIEEMKASYCVNFSRKGTKLFKMR